jgi:hypothetical protein
MRALVACRTAYADAIALALAAAVAFVAFVALAMAAWRTIAAAFECETVRLRELFEKQHALMQCAKLAVSSRDEWLNEGWNGVLHVLYHAQRHLNHGFHGDRFQRSRRTTFHRFAPITNTFPVFVDLLTLNLNDANHHFAKTANLVHESRYGLCMLSEQCNEIVTGPINIMCNRLLGNGVILTEPTCNVSHVGENQCGTLGHDIKG